jgi:small-conductance mechanosensitive channel/CRP-like cAMP-binding protein
MDTAITPSWQAWIELSLHDGLGWLLLLVALLTLPMLRITSQRQTLLNTLGFFLFALFGQLVAAAILIAEHSAGSTLRELFVVAEGLAVIRLCGLFVFHVILPRLHLAPPSILEDLLVIAAYLFWGMYRLHESGVELTSLVATSAVITAVLAFSMQETLGNILGGIALQMDNSIDKDDWIEINGITGRVVDIGWRSTAIETRNWETVIIPNSLLMKNHFTVLGRRQGQPRQWRRWVNFNVDYAEAPTRILQSVEQAIRQASIPGVASHPEPNCVLMSVDGSTAHYALRYWLTDLAADDPTDSAVRVHLYAALQRIGVVLAWPRQTVHMVKEGEKQQARRQARHVQERLQLLSHLQLFSHLDQNELLLASQRLVYSPFADGDVITRQGAIAHWLYVLAEGEVEVVLENTDGSRKHLAQIQAGHSDSFFGEMGLLTGEPRRATVIARSEVACYRLDKNAIEDLMQTRPAMAEEISSIMAERQIALEHARQDMDNLQHQQLLARQHHELLGKIKQFFGLG